MNLLIAVPVVAFEVNPDALVLAALEAIKNGQWSLVAVLAFVLLVALLRQFKRVIPWLGTSEGGTVLALVTAIAGTLGAAALAGIAITWGLLWSALATGVTAIGGYVAVRRLLRPVVAKIALRWPNSFWTKVLVWVGG